mmetsp:Transcript_103370/g.267368  ORF Transcript_103370/g.267368 Transcript_103370/m.267368 type:complete len:200 (-) Transcript_103370:221-820(-)
MHSCRTSSASTSFPVTNGPSGTSAQYSADELVQRCPLSLPASIPKTWKCGLKRMAWLSSLRFFEKSRKNRMLSLEAELIHRSIVTTGLVGMSQANSMITWLERPVAAWIRDSPSFAETRIEGMSMFSPLPSSATMIRRMSCGLSDELAASTMITAWAPLTCAAFTFVTNEQPPRLTMTMWMRRCCLPPPTSTSSGGGTV